jgi:uncharacterized membrane protein YhfC
MPTDAVSPLVLLSGAGMIVVALGFMCFAIWHRLGVRYLLLGALAWIVTVAVKFAWAIPMNDPIRRQLNSALPEFLAGPLFYLYIGILTGVTEVVLTWLLLRYTRVGRAKWPGVLAFSIGFGAVEALALGIASLMASIAALLAPDQMPPEVLSQMAAAATWSTGLAATWERFFTVWIHMFTCALLFYAIAISQPKWFWVAFWYKSLIDAIAAYWLLVMFKGGAGVWERWSLEAIAALWGAVGWCGIRWLRQQYALMPATDEDGPVAMDAST